VWTDRINRAARPAQQQGHGGLDGGLHLHIQRARGLFVRGGSGNLKLNP